MPHRLPVLPRIHSETPLPPLYARWVEELLGGPVPAETEATCDDCTMCRVPVVADRYDSKTRCCTYMPSLPNYLVGGVLADRSRAGRESAGARLEAGDGVTPWGMDATATFKVIYGQAWPAFGRAKGLLCPHYVSKGGLCGIWAYRNSVCATYFCVHVRAGVGRRFWGVTRDFLGAIEEELAVACMLELKLEPEQLQGTLGQRTPTSGRPAGLSHHAIDGHADPGAYRKAWGPWAGKEERFYRRCFEIVAPLSWRDVAAKCGPRVRARAQVVVAAYRDLLSTKLPARLRVAELSVRAHPDGGGLRSIAADRGNKTVDADDALFSALSRFRGQPVAEALATIEKELDVTLDEAALRTLVDLGVLVAVSER